MEEKHLTNVIPPFMIKTLNKLRSQRTFFNLMKRINNTTTANIIPNGERLSAFPLRLGTRYKWPLSLLFNCVLEGLTRHCGKKKKYLGWKERDNMITLKEKLKESTKTLQLITEFSNITGYKSYSFTNFQFIRYVFWKYFLPVCGLSFHFLYSVSHKAEVLNFLSWIMLLVFYLKSHHQI